MEKFEESVEHHEVKVGPFQEWRFEIKSNDKLRLKLIKGMAEIFGTELSPNTQYTFEGSFKSCISSFDGCTLEYWNCNPSSEYVGEETSMASILNLHLGLENYRQAHKEGAHVLVIGSKDSGKTSLCRTLASYAERMGNWPLLVNVSPKEPLFTAPGNLTATAVSGILNVENICLGETITTGPSFYHPKQPLVKCFGLENYRDNLKLYKFLIKQLSESIYNRMQQSPDIKKGGLIVDTPAFHIGDFDVIQEIIDDFHINVLVVVGNERLLVDLKRKLKYDTDKLSLLKISKSSGCVDNDDKFDREVQQRAIKEYFYGIHSSPLSPYTMIVKVKDFIFLKPKQVENLNLAFLSGADADDEEKGTTDKTINYKGFLERAQTPSAENLENAVLAFADDTDLDTSKYLTAIDDEESNAELIKAIVGRGSLGFGYVSECDDTKGTMKLLVPLPVQHLPTKTMILTEFRYHE